MSSRRSLIGEVSLPKTSEKVWNSCYTTVDDGFLSYSFDYALTSDLEVVSNVYGSANVNQFHQTLTKGNTIYTPKGLSLGIETFKILYWTPLEDDIYKYIMFPMHLVVGDNGDKGKMLYEYLTVKYPNSYSDGLSEEIYVDGDIKPYLSTGYRLTDGEGFYELKADGSITYESHSGGAVN